MEAPVRTGVACTPFCERACRRGETTVAPVADQSIRLLFTSKTGLQRQSGLDSCAARMEHRKRCLLFVAKEDRCNLQYPVYAATTVCKSQNTRSAKKMLPGQASL